MHTPKTFQQHDPELLEEIIVNYPFATLVTHSDSGLEVNHLPFILTHANGESVLQGHIAKANPLWKNLSENSEVLLVFHGPHCYISPNHYPTKQETGKAVPTWNYIAVHVKGNLSFIHDPKWKLNMINNLTNQHEATQESPWSISDAPEIYIEKMLPAIVGLQLEFLSITGQWKLSQNQPERNKQGVVTGLSKANDSDMQKVAELVKKYAL
ncbi:MAG: FMN-binding negative transcriptional regulator [Psychromonas sp.]